MSLGFLRVCLPFCAKGLKIEERDTRYFTHVYGYRESYVLIDSLVIVCIYSISLTYT